PRRSTGCCSARTTTSMPETPRPEILRRPEADAVPATVARPRTLAQKLAGSEALRKTLIVLALIAIWQAYAEWNDNPLVFPTFGATIEAFFDALADGALATQTLYSLRLLLQGYAAGVALAGLLSVLAVRSRLGGDLLDTLTAMLSPLPAIALLPLALLWFGIG